MSDAFEIGQSEQRLLPSSLLCKAKLPSPTPFRVDANLLSKTKRNTSPLETHPNTLEALNLKHPNSIQMFKTIHGIRTQRLRCQDLRPPHLGEFQETCIHQMVISEIPAHSI